MYHIALNRQIDLATINKNATDDKSPRHVMWEISLKLPALVHQPGNHPLLPIDYFGASIIGAAQHWALARFLVTQLGDDDVIFCSGEDVGIPIATVLGWSKKTKIIVYFHNINRPRGRLALQLFNLAQYINIFMTCSGYQADFLRRYLDLPPERVHLQLEQKDLNFFTPGRATTSKLRPIIANLGREKRDYQTLFAATAHLDVDVKMTQFSPEYGHQWQWLKRKIPSNVSCQVYSWPELRQLYRDADMVVITLFNNKYAAGVQVLLEALACQRPVIITETVGLREYLIADGIVTMVKPGDVVGLQRAINYLLSHPAEAQAQAQKGFEWVQRYHNSDQFVDNLMALLQSLHQVN